MGAGPSFEDYVDMVQERQHLREHVESLKAEADELEGHIEWYSLHLTFNISSQVPIFTVSCYFIDRLFPLPLSHISSICWRTMLCRSYESGELDLGSMESREQNLFTLGSRGSVLLTGQCQAEWSVSRVSSGSTIFKCLLL